MGIPLYRPPTPPVDPLSANVRNNNGVHRRAALSRRFPSREHSSQTFLDLLRSNSDFSRERSPSRHLSNIPSRLFPRISDDDPSATFSPYMQWRRVNDWAEPFNRNSAPRWRRRFDQMRREMLEREGYLSMEDREREQVDTSVPSLANLPIHPFDAGSDSLHQRYETAPSSMSAVETAPYRRSIALHRQQPDAISSQGSTTTDENERPDTSSTAANPGSSNSSAILRRRLPATRDLTAPRHINFFDNLGDRDRSQSPEEPLPPWTNLLPDDLGLGFATACDLWDADDAEFSDLINTGLTTLVEIRRRRGREDTEGENERDMERAREDLERLRRLNMIGQDRIPSRERAERAPSPEHTEEDISADRRQMLERSTRSWAGTRLF